MSPIVAILLGIVEGLTEYLPVSSTGHLILAGHLLHEEGPAADSYEIVIQLGAILAVLVHYRALLLKRARGLFAKERASYTLFSAILAGFLPTAVLGLLLRKTIKAYLFGPMPVIAALAVGGAIMILSERIRRSRGEEGEVGLEHVTPKRGFLIGLGQCVSMWPGSSRSMCTILAGQLTGLSTATAAEFSFLLGLPTLGAATLYEGYKARATLLHDIGTTNLAIGLIVSFFVAWGVVSVFIRYLSRRGLEPFGWYRIAAALAFYIFMTR